tara:strand:+ start:583 stop:870 length:288 start_codon:yes stop_codon:yes gene_type:complete
MKSFAENVIGIIYSLIYIFGFFYEPFLNLVQSIFGEITLYVIYPVGLLFWLYIGYIFVKSRDDKEGKKEFKRMMSRVRYKERKFKKIKNNRKKYK